MSQHCNLRVLIAEKQYLIAMEVERILIEEAGCSTQICGSSLEAELASARYDIVMLDVSPSAQHNLSRAQMVVESGAWVVFLSSYEPHSDENKILADYMIIPKPFDSAAVMAALRWVNIAKEADDRSA